jgi:hypothetical protein
MNKGVLAILLGLVLAVGFAMSAADRAEALTLYVPENGFVVPYVVADTAKGLDTAIGVTVIPQAPSPLWLKWTFFNERSVHIMDDKVCVTPGDFEGFFWSQMMGSGLNGVRGYLVFNDASTDGSYLTANAFLIKGLDVAAFIPVLPLSVDDISWTGSKAACPLPITFQLADVISAQFGIQAGDNVLLRYAIDGLESRIVCWFVANPSATLTVDIYDSNEQNVSVSIDLPHEISIIDPARDILGRPNSFVDGFIHVGSTAQTWPYDGIAFTLVANGDPLDLSPMPTEIQTLMAVHYVATLVAR